MNLSRLLCLTVALHKIGIQNDCPEAEEIRCQMDEIWYYNLTVDEMLKAQKFSALLFKLETLNNNNTNNITIQPIISIKNDAKL